MCLLLPLPDVIVTVQVLQFFFLLLLETLDKTDQSLTTEYTSA